MPNAISKRISVISSSKEICDEHIGYYKDALKHSGYDNTSLWYNPTQQQGDNQIKKKTSTQNNKPTFFHERKKEYV